MIHDGSQKRNMVVINESGLYSLILSSKLPKAKEFKRWITNEVLSYIRKHEAYMTEETIQEDITKSVHGNRIILDKTINVKITSSSIIKNYVKSNYDLYWVNKMVTPCGK